MRNELIKTLNVIICVFVVVCALTAAMESIVGVSADRTPPEAVIHFDPETREIVVMGIDNMDEEVEVTETILKEKKHEKTSLFTLKDDAGNTMDLKLKVKYDKKHKDFAEAQVLEICYDDGEPITFKKKDIQFENEFKRDKKKGGLKGV